jgi:hypothetical protein
MAQDSQTIHIRKPQIGKDEVEGFLAEHVDAL